MRGYPARGQLVKTTKKNVLCEKFDAPKGRQYHPPAAGRAAGLHGVWRSLVAHLLWEQDVGSSNLSTPTRLAAAAQAGLLARCVPWSGAWRPSMRP